jgi:hypothetical protein
LWQKLRQIDADVIARKEKALAQRHERARPLSSTAIPKFESYRAHRRVWAKSHGTADVTTLGDRAILRPRGSTKPRVPTARAKAPPPSCT